ncbi:MAG: HAMP domain-containing protein [Rhizobiales bacterium]|nr:HAMP domain-containing protein [Hyphomicrobiales bacterium]
MRRIADLAIELTPADIILGTGEDPHVALLSIRLPDSTWLNVSLFDTRRPRQARHGALLSTSLMAVGVALLAFVVARWLSRPLVEMAGRVRRLRPDDGPSPLAETGPSEVRELASAFNAMQRRVADSVAQRTRSLAAVSHDLRTPLTRLRLRLDEVGDPALRDAIGRDIGDMEQMISATLAYLRGDGAGEPRRPVDLVALLGTIVDDAVDAGRSATLVAPDHAVVQARHLGIKRAVTNLVDNALRFGGEVRVELRLEAAHAVVTVEDDGPGIPEDHLENVLEPFVRLEDSRNAETGGVGLGLTIARAAVEADGGSLALANRPEGGLSATIRLPLPVR